MLRHTQVAFAASAAIAVAAISPASAQTDDAVAQFYSGKTITIAVPGDAGGTYGKYGRMIAQFMKRHIPGQPRIKIKHMPGAGLKLLNFAYNELPQDGTGLVMPMDTLIVFELLMPEKTKYKSRNFTWLGSLIRTNSVTFIRSDTGVRSVRDMRNTEIVMASTGLGSPSFLMPAMINGLLGTRMKVVRGFKGARKIISAIERGRAQGGALPWGSIRASKPSWVRSRFVVPVVQVGSFRDPSLPNVPMVTDLVSNQDDLKIVKFMASFSSIGRSVAAPPNVPQMRVAALRKAFDMTVRDPRFLSQAKKRKLRIKPTPGLEVQSVVNDATNVSPEIVRRARRVILGPAQ